MTVAVPTVHTHTQLYIMYVYLFSDVLYQPVNGEDDVAMNTKHLSTTIFIWTRLNIT